ncbi:MAG: RES family NAD+ phosphorylase [Proteobacteria bacterium]|nr:RES family NAD+ phosphorylase [Pseudomonadota bacterium]
MTSLQPASVSVWRLATQGPAWRATDLDGKGAATTGGRWNAKDMPVVYAAQSIALACLETVVHLNASGLPIARYVVQIQIPAAVWQRARRLDGKDLPRGWNQLPRSVSAAAFGTAWLQGRASALLLVPSVIVPLEYNVLINPLHPDAAHITATDRGRFHYDGRLLPGR